MAAGHLRIRHRTARPERQGLLGYGSSLDLHERDERACRCSRCLLRKASGAGYYAMEGLPYGPVLQLATPLARLAVMEGRTLAIGAYNTKLDDDVPHRGVDDRKRPRRSGGDAGGRGPDRARHGPGARRVAAGHRRDRPPSELRLWISSLVAMAYQAIGYRRVKNPRIWSLHDLNVLRG